MLELINSLIFLGVGYFLGRYHNDKKIIQETIKQIKRRHNGVKPGVLEYPTQADIDYTESGEEKVDQERERVFKEYFKP